MTNTKSIGRRGFTLIEMLIVIAIIGILASVVLVGLGPVQRQGRDSRRISDLRSVQTVLELYYNKCGYYPGGTWANPAPCDQPFSSIGDQWATLQGNLTGSNLGIKSVPDDPSAPSKHYHYGTNSDGTSYTIAADLEDLNNPIMKNSAGPSNGLLTCGINGTVATYCIEF